MTLFFGMLEPWTVCVFCRMLLFLEFWLVFMCLLQDHDFENYLFSTSVVICRQALLLNSLCYKRGFTVRQALLLDKGSRRAGAGGRGWGSARCVMLKCRLRY